MTTHRLEERSIGTTAAEQAARENEEHRQELFEQSEDGVDEASDESFPCSDPPSHSHSSAIT